MATMYPSNIENYSCTKTEALMFKELKEQLPDKFQVFYSVRWFETDENNHRIDSESDFLIFDPSYGFITIEVKGGTGIKIENGHWYLEQNFPNSEEIRRELKCSPYEQAEKSMRHFHKNFAEEFNQSFSGVYGFAVAFPSYSIDSPLAQEAPLELTIDSKDMDNLAQKINNIFHYWRNKRNLTIPFSAQQRKSFIKLVNKQISISAAAGALIPIKQKEFSKIDFVQDTILDMLHNYPQVQIVGGAGTGKTFIGIKKAVEDGRNGKRVLFTCRNNELILFARRKTTHINTITCITFDELMIKLLGEETYQNCINQENFFEYVDSFNESEKFDSIVVDEAQDFNVDMGLTIRSLLVDDNKSDLYVMYDKNQNVFDISYEDAFAIDSKPFVLRYNIRNTGSIYRCAVETTNLGSDTIANQLEGVQPEISKYSNKSQTLIALSSIVNRLIRKEYVKNQSIVVITDTSFEDSILSTETKIGAFEISRNDLSLIKDNEICVKSAEEFKGLESDIVIYLQLNDDLPHDRNHMTKEYVAMTRARYYLYILKTKNTR